MTIEVWQYIALAVGIPLMLIAWIMFLFDIGEWIGGRIWEWRHRNVDWEAVTRDVFPPDSALMNMTTGKIAEGSITAPPIDPEKACALLKRYWRRPAEIIPSDPCEDDDED